MAQQVKHFLHNHEDQNANSQQCVCNASTSVSRWEAETRESPEVGGTDGLAQRVENNKPALKQGGRQELTLKAVL